jgi:hypothetical protein
MPPANPGQFISFDQLHTPSRTERAIAVVEAAGAEEPHIGIAPRETDPVAGILRSM